MPEPLRIMPTEPPPARAPGFTARSPGTGLRAAAFFAASYSLGLIPGRKGTTCCCSGAAGAADSAWLICSGVRNSGAETSPNTCGTISGPFVFSPCAGLPSMANEHTSSSGKTHLISENLITCLTDIVISFFVLHNHSADLLIVCGAGETKSVIVGTSCFCPNCRNYCFNLHFNRAPHAY